MIAIADLPFTMTLEPPAGVQTASVAVSCVDQDGATFVFGAAEDEGGNWIAELNLATGRYKVSVAGYYNDAPSWRLPWQLITVVSGDGST